MLKRLLLAIALISSAPVFAQAPPAVPALPDAERRTSYSLSASTCACNVNFALYGDSTDYGNWIEVFLVTGSGTSTVSTKLTAVTDYTITSPTGSLATIPRPISDAVLTLTAAKTGTLQIVGSRRPRRTSQFSENRGVAARDLNQALTDIVAQNREVWDRTNDTTGRAILAPPAETLGVLPAAAARAGGFLCWDSTGFIPLACGPGNGSGNVVGPNVTVVGHVATYGNTSGTILLDGGLIGTGNVTGPGGATDGAFALYNGTTGALLKNGPTLISNSNLAQSASGATIKGNPTASGASVQDFTIQGLTNKPTPNANNDYLPLYDASTGTIKSVTPGQLVSGTTAGVSLLNGLSGSLAVVGGTGISVSAAGSSITASLSTPVSLANGGTGTTNMYSFITGLQPLKLTTSPGNIIGVNPGQWSDGNGTKVYSSTNNTNVAVPNYGAMTADLTTAGVNWTSTPQPTGGQISGALSSAGSTTNGTEVFLYLIHRISDNRTALVGSSSDTISGAAYTFTATVAAPGVLTCTNAPCSTGAGHGLRKRMAVYLSNSGGALPVPFGTGVQYYVCSVPSSTSITLATSIANANSSSCLTTTTSGSGTNTMAWGVQRDLDFQLTAGVATVDRRLPWFATVWQSAWDFIPNFTVPQGGSRTLLTSMDETTNYCTGALAPGASYLARGFSNQLANINRQALFHVICTGGASGGACFMRTTSSGGSQQIGPTVAAGATYAADVELATDSTGQVDISATSTANINVCLKGWTQMDPS